MNTGKKTSALTVRLLGRDVELTCACRADAHAAAARRNRGAVPEVSATVAAMMGSDESGRRVCGGVIGPGTALLRTGLPDCSERFGLALRPGQLRKKTYGTRLQQRLSQKLRLLGHLQVFVVLLHPGGTICCAAGT